MIDKFILRVGFWPCADDTSPIPHVMPSGDSVPDHPMGTQGTPPPNSPPPVFTKESTIAPKTTGGKTIETMKDGGYQGRSLDTPSAPVNFSSENPAANSRIGSPTVGQHAHDTRVSEMLRNYGDLKHNSIISTAILDLDGTKGGFVNSFGIRHNSYVRGRERSYAPAEHADGGAKAFREEPGVKDGGGKFHQMGFSQVPKTHDHPHPHEHPDTTDFSPLPHTTDFSPLPHSTDFSPLPHTTDFSPLPHSTDFSPLPHSHEHPHPIEHDDREVTPLPTWPGGWCDTSYYGEHSSGYGTQFSDNCLYATYMFSREFHDAGNHPDTGFGSNKFYIDDIEFKVTGVGSNAGVMFPEVYYDDLSEHHGMNINSPRSQKFFYKIPSDISDTEGAYLDVYSIPQAWLILPKVGDEKLKMCFIDSEDYRITRAMNLVPNNDEVNSGSTVSLADSFVVQNTLGIQQNLNDLGTLSLDTASIVTSVPTEMLPPLYANASWAGEDDGRNFVTVTFAAGQGFLNSGNAKELWVPICNWRDSQSGNPADPYQSPHPNWNQTPLVPTHFINPVPGGSPPAGSAFNEATFKFIETVYAALDYDDAWKVITACDMVGNAGTIYDDTQHLRLKVTNNHINAPLNSGDNLIVTPKIGTIPSFQGDPALAFNIGDSIVIDYGRGDASEPQCGFTDGVTSVTSNNQNIYTIVWYSINAEGQRIIEVNNGEVTVNESRTRIGGSDLGATRMRRVNHLPKLELTWKSDKVPDYSNYKPALINF